MKQQINFIQETQEKGGDGERDGRTVVCCCCCCWCAAAAAAAAAESRSMGNTRWCAASSSPLFLRRGQRDEVEVVVVVVYVIWCGCSASMGERKKTLSFRFFCCERCEGVGGKKRVGGFSVPGWEGVRLRIYSLRRDWQVGPTYLPKIILPELLRSISILPDLLRSISILALGSVFSKKKCIDLFHFILGKRKSIFALIFEISRTKQVFIYTKLNTWNRPSSHQ